MRNRIGTLGFLHSIDNIKPFIIFNILICHWNTINRPLRTLHSIFTIYSILLRCQVGKRRNPAGGSQRECVCHYGRSLLLHRARFLSGFQRSGKHQRQYPGGRALWVQSVNTPGPPEWDSTVRLLSVIFVCSSFLRAMLRFFLFCRKIWPHMVRTLWFSFLGFHPC